MTHIITVKGYGPLKEATVFFAEHGGVLYGASGSGKTSLMAVLHAVIGSEKKPKLFDASAANQDFSIVASPYVPRKAMVGKSVEVELVREQEGSDRFEVRRGGKPVGRSHPLDLALPLFSRAAELDKVGGAPIWIRPGAALDADRTLYPTGARLFGRLRPDELQRLRAPIRLITGVSDPFAARDSTGKLTWYVENKDGVAIPFSRLGRGERQAILTVAGATVAQGAIFVEGLEPMDTALASRVLEYLRETAKEKQVPLFVEARNPSLLATAFKVGMAVYYMEDGKIKKRATKPSDLADVGLYRKEPEGLSVEEEADAVRDVRRGRVVA